MDIGGQLSQRAWITLILDDVCSQTIQGDTVTISYMGDFEELNICRGLELDLNVRGNQITSLRPLNHIRVSIAFWLYT